MYVFVCSWFHFEKRSPFVWNGFMCRNGMCNKAWVQEPCKSALVNFSGEAMSCRFFAANKWSKFISCLAQYTSSGFASVYYQLIVLSFLCSELRNKKKNNWKVYLTGSCIHTLLNHIFHKVCHLSFSLYLSSAFCLRWNLTYIIHNNSNGCDHMYLHIFCCVVFAQETSNEKCKTLNCDTQVVDK